MTKDEALKKMQAVKSYMTSGNPIWSVTEIGEAFDMAIEALEQPEPQWIPCSERLPELTEAFSDAEGFDECEDGFYMPVGVYTAYESNAVLAFGTFEGNKNIFTAIYNEWRYEDGRKESEWRDNMTGDVEINVISWMPLPEPWEGEEKG